VSIVYITAIIIASHLLAASVEYCPNITSFSLSEPSEGVDISTTTQSAYSESDRAAGDGSWYVVQSLNLYVYSAFYDARATSPSLRVIGVFEQPFYRRFYCHITYLNVDSVYVSTAELDAVGAGVDIGSHHLQVLL